MKFEFIPSDFVCSRRFCFEIDEKEDVILSLFVTGGCHGNLQGISKLLPGMKVEEAVRRLEGITCGGKPTSCPDQIAEALKREYLSKKN
ncbi:MAG: TIGR03905 family TSCPD domain-containing protein [Lentisphaeria bacterium]|nr:TIGR03905 family TSCPD domain-containing protein [Lentisphaeria bacterium]